MRSALVATDRSRDEAVLSEQLSCPVGTPRQIETISQRAVGSAFGRAPQLFAIGRAGDMPSPALSGTQVVTLPQRGPVKPTVDIFAAVPDRLRTHYDAATDRAIYLLGHAGHPIVSGPALLRRAAEAHAAGDVDFLRAIAGVYVFIIDDRRLGRVTFQADAMGVRPWFVGAHGGRLTAGSDVLQLCAAGLSNGRVNYDAVATWLLLNQPLGDATVVDDYANLPAGVAMTFAATGERTAAFEFGRLTYADEPITPDELAERQYTAINDILDGLLDGVSETHVLLSGGYDSRLLAGLISKRTGIRVRLSNLDSRAYETPLAQAIAAALGQPLDVVPSRPRISDFFDEPFVTTPAGFIGGMNLTNALIRRRPGVPNVSGLMGDGTMRGSVIPTSTHFAQEKAGLGVSELASMVAKRFTLHDHRLNLLHPSLRDAIHERAMAAIGRFVAGGVATGKPLIYADLYGRHRHYFPANVLQPLAWSEPIVPLSAWALADLRVRHPQAVFGRETYPTLFRRFLPELAAIPHSYDADYQTTGQPKPASPPSRHCRQWGIQLAKATLFGRLRGAVPLKKVGRVAFDAFRRQPHEEKELKFLFKLQRFEQTLCQSGIRFEWEGLSG